MKSKTQIIFIPEISAKKFSNLPKGFESEKNILVYDFNEFLKKKFYANSGQKILLSIPEIKNAIESEKIIESLNNSKINMFGLVLKIFDPENYNQMQFFIRLKLLNNNLKIFYSVTEKIKADQIQSALDLGFDGLVFENGNPSKKNFEIIAKLKTRNEIKVNSSSQKKFSKLRKTIDEIDEELLQLLSERIEKVEKLAAVKKRNDLKILQKVRWNEILKTTIKRANKAKIDIISLQQILDAIHLNAIKVQRKIYNK